MLDKEHPGPPKRRRVRDSLTWGINNHMTRRRLFPTIMRAPSMFALLLLLHAMPVLSTALNFFEDSQAVFTFPHAATFAPAGLPHPNPSKSFWIDSAPDANPLAREGSEGSLTSDADVCIIGSGMTGVSAAYALSKQTPGLKVVILEARNFCQVHPNRMRGIY